MPIFACGSLEMPASATKTPIFMGRTSQYLNVKCQRADGGLRRRGHAPRNHPGANDSPG